MSLDMKKPMTEAQLANAFDDYLDRTFEYIDTGRITIYPSLAIFSCDIDEYDRLFVKWLGSEDRRNQGIIQQGEEFYYVLSPIPTWE